MLKDKRGEMDIPFGWLFGLLVGAVILALAIYMSSSLFKVEQTKIDASSSKEIGILMNALELGVESRKKSFMRFPAETRLELDCNLNRPFGKQTITLSQKSFDKWTNSGIEVSFNNRYIFSDSFIEGKQISIISKQFNFPYQVASLIYFIPEKKEYCFKNAPESVIEEVKDLKNIKTECNTGEVVVCFSEQSGCDVIVRMNEGTVQKKGKKSNFIGEELMYAAIFSDLEIYECQVKRLMIKTASLAMLYREKASIISRAGCNNNLEELAGFSSYLNAMEDSSSLSYLSQLATKIGDINNANSVCRLW